MEHLENFYGCFVSGISEKMCLAKFDTGAVHTVITPDIFYGRPISDAELSSIKYSLEKNYSNVSVELESASGHATRCYLSHLSDINISGIKLKDFYFFLMPQKNSKFLLGDDFISKITFRHEINSAIVISEFDYDSYCRYFKSYVDTLQMSDKYSNALPAGAIADMLSFNKEEYLKEYLSILPVAAVADCVTKEDCDALLSSVRLPIPRG